jgi:hypothetical protein
MKCRTVEGGALCAFCEDDVICPEQQRLRRIALAMASRAESAVAPKAVRVRGKLTDPGNKKAKAMVSDREFEPRKESSVKDTNVKKCQCSPDCQATPVNKPNAVYAYGHKPKGESVARAFKSEKQREKVAHAHASIGDDEGDVGVTRRRTPVAAGNGKQLEQGSGSNGYASAKFSPSTMSVDSYRQRFNKWADSDMEAIVTDVEKFVVGDGLVLLYNPPTDGSKAPAKSFRDRVGRYIDAHHKDLAKTIIVSQDIKNNHVAIKRA